MNQFRCGNFSCDVEQFCKDGILISGYLSKKEFSSELVVDKFLEYLEKEIPGLKNVDVRYHIECVGFNVSYEYNGEY